MQAEDDDLTSAQNGASRVKDDASSTAALKAAAAESDGGKEMSRVLQLLQNLSQLSTQLRNDAQEDDKIFREEGGK